MKNYFHSNPEVCFESKPLALNRKQAANAIGISVVTLDRLVARGLLRPSRGCRRPLFSIRELERFLQITTSLGGEK